MIAVMFYFQFVEIPLSEFAHNIMYHMVKPYVPRLDKSSGQRSIYFFNYTIHKKDRLSYGADAQSVAGISY